MNHLEVMYFRGFAGADEPYTDGDLVQIVDPIEFDAATGLRNVVQWDVGIVRMFPSSDGDIYGVSPLHDRNHAIRVQCGEYVLDHCELFFHNPAIPY